MGIRPEEAAGGEQGDGGAGGGGGGGTRTAQTAHERKQKLAGQKFAWNPPLFFFQAFSQQI